MVYLSSDYHLNGDPDFPSDRGNYRCGGEWHTDPALYWKIEPCNLSTTTPLVINQDMDPIDLAKKANPCLCNEEHKQEQERQQQNCRWMINLTKLGSHKPMNGETVLDRLSKQNPNPNDDGGVWL